MLKECKKHGLFEHALECFGTKNQRYRCKKCRSEAVQRKRLNLKKKAVQYKGGKCCKCGYDKCQDALDFHHVNPNEKDFAISAKGYLKSWEKIKTELDKCLLVCANCHREIHSQNKKDYYMPMETKSCKSCGQEFETKNSIKAYCSDKCRIKEKNKRFKQK